MPRYARLAPVLALLMLAMTLPIANAAGPAPLAVLPGTPELTGTAHPATTAEPWSGVALSWTPNTAALGYQVWRKGPADVDFVALLPATGTIDLFYADSAVQPSTAYAYFVVPITLLQVYLPSNVVTVTAPALTPVDATAPVATIVSPVSGAKVSGTVRVSATATDNVAVTAMELRTATGTLLKSVAGSSLTYDWNTRGLKRRSTQTLVVRAFDAAGNVGTTSVTVTIK